MAPLIYSLLLCSFIALASAQFPNGQYKGPLNGNANCGTCPQGTERTAAPGGYGNCGICVPGSQTCAPGYYKNGNTCQNCPCPGNGNGNPFGTTCYVDKNGEVNCNCPTNYSGRDCSTCAPGCIQDQQYPYSCVRPNNTGPQVLPPVVVPPVVVPPPACPTNGCASPCGTNCGTNCGSNCQIIGPMPQPVPQPCPTCPVIGPVPQPQPCPTCPVNNCGPNCPAGGNCGPTCAGANCGNCGQIVQPGPSPCPQCPQCPQQCPQCPQCPGTQCPDCNCGPCPTTQCPPCPSPCQKCPAIPPCNNCPNPCQQCPSLTCYPQNVTCPNLTCPTIPPCPQCNMSREVLSCETSRRNIECCDPRGKLPDLYGRCICKENVEGHQCSVCRKGYFGLSEFNPSGCSKCFGSGVTDYCKVAVLYRTTLQVRSGAVFQIAEMTSSGITVIDAVTASSGSASKTFVVPRAKKLVWVLPSEFLGNRITSYGGRLSCSRRYSGASPLGSDHDVIIVGARGGIIYWSSFSSPAAFKEETFSTLLSERGAWIVSQDGNSRPATRADILFVLAEIQAIYVRASFSATTSSTVIRDCKLDSVSESVTSEGLTLDVEQCRCPPGYKGLSCESCSHGYYRDISDTGRCVFGACKKCPCGPHADGCRYELGSVICSCRAGYTGPLCQDREYLTLSMDPFRIREIVNTVVEFNCSYITNSKNRFTLAISTLPPGIAQRVETTSAAIQSSVPLLSNLTHVVCKLVDATGLEVACAKSTIVIDIATTTVIIPPPPLVSIIASKNFICVNETDEIIGLNCTVVAYGLSRVNIEWRKENENGTTLLSDYDLRDMRRAAKQSHAGTYICSASVGNVTAIERIAIVVIPISRNITIDSRGLRADDPNAYNDTESNNVLTTTEDPKKIAADTNKLPEKRPEGFPTIKIEPMQLKVKVGEPATLKCEAKGKAPLKYYWKSAKSSYIPHHVRAAHGSLMFEAVTKNDEGDYFCVAWNELGQSSETATLTVLDSGNSQKTGSVNGTLTVVPSEVTAYPGENIDFQCIIRDPSARIIWKKKDADLPTSSEVKGDGVLTLYRVSTPNEGVYICSAIFPNGQTIQAEGRLTVTSNIVSSIPTIQLQPRSPHKVRSGDRVLLDCQSSGEPTPSVVWSRSIAGKEQQLVVSATPSSIHEISHVTKADEGKYTCTATNKAGTKLESLSLLVDDAIICKGTEFRCKSGDQCVSKDDRCDGEKDCKDGSDEHHCRRHKIQ